MKKVCITSGAGSVGHSIYYHTSPQMVKGVLAIRHIFCLVGMITNTKFSKCPYYYMFFFNWCSLAVKYAW